MTLVLTLIYLVLLLNLTPVFTAALPVDLVLYSFIPAALVSTGIIYVLALLVRNKLGLGTQSGLRIEKDVAHVGPSSHQVPQPIPSPFANPYQQQQQAGPPPTPQPIQAAPPPPQTRVKFCMYCGKVMDLQLQVCPNCHKSQW